MKAGRLLRERRSGRGRSSEPFLRGSVSTCMMKRTLLLFAWSALALCAAGCAINPVSGERQLALISEGQEIDIGRQSAAAAEAQLGLVDDAEMQAYVQGLGVQLAQASERPDLPWTFRVIDDATPNAFAAPGGYIFVTRGLLALIRNEAELVSVLGHEIGHVTARHSVTMMSRAQLAQIGLGVGSIVSPTIAQLSELVAGGLQVLFLKYGRDAERQADDLGYDYALAQGYDVRHMVSVFAALQQSAELAGQSPMPSWLASHPYPEERIARINKRLVALPSSPELRAGEVDYLAQIDGLTYGADPRHGYFEDDRFLHPDLEFRMDIPTGWFTQNMPQAMVAGSPEKDALIQLTLAKGEGREAADAWFAQEGVTAGRVAGESVNGLAAVIGTFSAQTEQGALGGIAAFITHAELTYQILAYAPAERFSAYERAFRSTIESFSRLTDEAALARQPNRLAIVRVPRAMSLTEFNQAHPSTIPIEELALINQLAGPDAVMAGNFQAKRVISR
jgi:predicted Zn-dependent protease